MTTKAAHTTVDPVTGKELCDSCWAGWHGSKKEPGCKVPGCCCFCKSIIPARCEERAAKKAAQRQRKELAQQQLEAEHNPLRASNPSQQTPWLKLPKEE